ncbi:MAG TPA: ABC transporter ATP-binding protein [Acidimicrobiales bacterium]
MAAGPMSAMDTAGTAPTPDPAPAPGTADATGAPADRDAAPTSGLAVSARGATRSFGDRHVLQDIDLDLRADEFVALLGRSGSGKTTLLRILAGLDPGAEGEIHVAERRAVVFQDARLLPWLSVLDNVVLGLRDGRAADRGRAALAEVGLAGHEDDWPKTLSGGEAQRAALARALVREPQLLLLDEPFGALDALTRVRMHALVQELCARHRPAVLLVTHDVDEAVLLADRVLVLTEGRISLDVPVDVPTPRLRHDPRFAALRSRLLAELGVDEAAEGARPPARPPTRPAAPSADPPGGAP